MKEFKKYTPITPRTKLAGLDLSSVWSGLQMLPGMLLPDHLPFLLLSVLLSWLLPVVLSRLLPVLLSGQLLPVSVPPSPVSSALAVFPHSWSPA